MFNEGKGKNNPYKVVLPQKMQALTISPQSGAQAMQISPGAQSPAVSMQALLPLPLPIHIPKGRDSKKLNKKRQRPAQPTSPSIPRTPTLGTNNKRGQYTPESERLTRIHKSPSKYQRKENLGQPDTPISQEHFRDSPLYVAVMKAIQANIQELSQYDAKCDKTKKKAKHVFQPPQQPEPNTVYLRQTPDQKAKSNTWAYAETGDTAPKQLRFIEFSPEKNNIIETEASIPKRKLKQGAAGNYTLSVSKEMQKALPELKGTRVMISTKTQIKQTRFPTLIQGAEVWTLHNNGPTVSEIRSQERIDFLKKLLEKTLSNEQIKQEKEKQKQTAIPPKSWKAVSPKLFDTYNTNPPEGAFAPKACISFLRYEYTGADKSTKEGLIIAGSGTMKSRPYLNPAIELAAKKLNQLSGGDLRIYAAKDLEGEHIDQLSVMRAHTAAKSTAILKDRVTTSSFMLKLCAEPKLLFTLIPIAESLSSDQRKTLKLIDSRNFRTNYTQLGIANTEDIRPCKGNCAIMCGVYMDLLKKTLHLPESSLGKNSPRPKELEAHARKRQRIAEQPSKEVVKTAYDLASNNKGSYKTHKKLFGVIEKSLSEQKGELTPGVLAAYGSTLLGTQKHLSPSKTEKDVISCTEKQLKNQRALDRRPFRRLTLFQGGTLSSNSNLKGSSLSSPMKGVTSTTS